MTKKFITSIIICLFILCNTSLIFSQTKTKESKKERRNNWGIGIVYSESGVGVSSSLYTPISKSADLFFKLMVSGLSDSRELERYDVLGNSIIPDKINRIFIAPLSIGIKKELFKDDLDGDFIPVINFGIAPTLVLTNPYNKSFFNAIGFTKSKFAFGGFGGIGVNFRQSKSVSMNVNINYYFLPIIGDPVVSIQNSKIKDVGGFQIAFGLNFLK
ncbi:MAG: hypothetical protein ABIY50_07415 [Ignavibacteria bacterium]